MSNDRDPFAFAGEHPGAEPAKAGDDAELFRLIAEEQVLMDTAVDHDEPDGNRAKAKRYFRLAAEVERKILQTGATTIAGVIALLEHDHIDADEIALASLRELAGRVTVAADPGDDGANATPMIRAVKLPLLPPGVRMVRADRRAWRADRPRRRRVLVARADVRDRI
jgi:hypothetical protein